MDSGRADKLFPSKSKHSKLVKFPMVSGKVDKSFQAKFSSSVKLVRLPMDAGKIDRLFLLKYSDSKFVKLQMESGNADK